MPPRTRPTGRPGRTAPQRNSSTGPWLSPSWGQCGHHQHHQPSAGARGPHPYPRVTAVGSEDMRSVQDVPNQCVPNAEHAGHRVPVLEAPKPESSWGGPIRSTQPLPGEGAEAEEELCQLSSRAPGGPPGAATGGHLQEGPAQLVRATCGGKWVSDPLLGAQPTPRRLCPGGTGGLLWPAQWLPGPSSLPALQQGQREPCQPARALAPAPALAFPGPNCWGRFSLKKKKVGFAGVFQLLGKGRIQTFSIWQLKAEKLHF